MKRAWLLLPVAALAVAIIIPLGAALGDDGDDTVTLGAELGAAFTYQGRFTDGGEPADGTYDLRFILYDEDAGGAQVGETVLKEDVAVSEGMFTTTLDFGINAFDGEARWLEIAVKPGSSGEFTVLNPRQPITAVPYALHALTAGGGGLALPFEGSGESESPNSLFEITQTDTGIGVDVIRNETETEAPALRSVNDGAGPSFTAMSTHDAGIGALLSGPTAVSLDGAIAVTGTTPAAFRLIVDTDEETGNTCEGDTMVAIDSPLANGDPGALIFATFNSTTTPRAFGVDYDPGGDCPEDQWVVYVDAGGDPLADGDAFNILIINTN